MVWFIKEKYQYNKFIKVLFRCVHCFCTVQNVIDVFIFILCLWCVDAVRATFAVILNGGGGCFVAGSLAIDGFIFAFGGGQEAIASCCSGLVVLLKKKNEYFCLLFEGKPIAKSKKNIELTSDSDAHLELFSHDLARL